MGFTPFPWPRFFPDCAWIVKVAAPGGQTTVPIAILMSLKSRARTFPNAAFGLSAPNTRLDPSVLSGFEVRPYSWQGGISVQRELRQGLPQHLGAANQVQHIVGWNGSRLPPFEYRGHHRAFRFHLSESH